LPVPALLQDVRGRPGLTVDQTRGRPHGQLDSTSEEGAHTVQEEEGDKEQPENQAETGGTEFETAFNEDKNGPDDGDHQEMDRSKDKVNNDGSAGSVRDEDVDEIITLNSVGQFADFFN